MKIAKRQCTLGWSITEVSRKSNKLIQPLFSGCFLILQILEVNDRAANEIVKEKLEKAILSKKKEISKTKGGQLLIEKAFANGKMRVELDAFRNVCFIRFLSLRLPMF